MGRAGLRTWFWTLALALAVGCTPAGSGNGGGGGDDEDDGVLPADTGVDADRGPDDPDQGEPEPDGGEPEPDMGEPEPEPDGGEPEPDMGEPEPDPDMGEPEPDMGEPEPDPDMGEPEPDMGCVPVDEACNGADDDCDGAIDEETGGEACQTGLPGVCAAGTTVCDGGEPSCAPVAEPAEEICDALDNDCDGVVDDVPGVGGACAAGVGACSVQGTVICTADGLECDAVPGEPGVEACNGRDDDCDGEVDNVIEAGRPCTAGEGECAVDGVLACAGGELACDAAPGLPGDEVCNGLDDDCDGVVDDVDGLGDPCAAGVGACAAAGELICGVDGLECSAEPGAPRDEVCNDLDDDCNGVVDDAPVCDPAPVEDCAAVGDEDGNGLADCDDPVCAGLPACAPGVQSIVLLCGDSARDISVIFRPEDDVVFQGGCVPDANTRAMAVSRSGVVEPALVVPWLEAGGRIMTEYSGTDEVFNAVFGEAVQPPPGQTGSCRDNVNPVVRFNEDDPFWQVNGDLPLAPLAESGCGFDVSAYPGIVPLGGWNADTVSLAYRDLGQGRFWLVEGDWQDTDQGADSFSAATQQLMRHMLVGELVPRNALMVCGDTTRDMNTFVPPGSGLVVAQGCQPDGEVQAMVISRGGAGQLDGDQLRGYLQGGGIAITEYNISDEVYNAVFPGAGVLQGEPRGGCSDQVNPPVRFNEGDVFWQVNGELPLGDPDNAGCGFDVGAFPGVTPLGGWDADTVSLAYIDVGAGRLWLVDIDWQDANAGFGDASLQLMRYMILHRGDGAALELCATAGDEDGNGLADCDDPACVGHPFCAVPEDCVLPGDEDGNGLADCLDPACEGLPECRVAALPVGSFVVADGPQWSDPGVVSVSCVQACAQIFGGAAADYGCSTVDGQYNGRAWLDGWGDGQAYCSDGNDGPEDFVMPVGGGAYDCGEAGCSYSAYVSDHGCNRTNYCWRRGIDLDPNQAFGHHGNCETYNDCGTAERCADLGCLNAGHGEALDWQEGLCTTLSQGPVPDIVCNLFNANLPNNLDANWGPPAFDCDIPVVYGVSCEPAP